MHTVHLLAPTSLMLAAEPTGPALPCERGLIYRLPEADSVCWLQQGMQEVLPYQLTKEGRRGFRLVTPFSIRDHWRRYVPRNAPRLGRWLQGPAARDWLRQVGLDAFRTLGVGVAVAHWEYQGPFGAAGVAVCLDDPLGGLVSATGFTKPVRHEGARCWADSRRLLIHNMAHARTLFEHVRSLDERSIHAAYGRQP